MHVPDKVLLKSKQISYCTQTHIIKSSILLSVTCGTSLVGGYEVQFFFGAVCIKSVCVYRSFYGTDITW